MPTWEVDRSAFRSALPNFRTSFSRAAAYYNDGDNGNDNSNNGDDDDSNNGDDDSDDGGDANRPFAASRYRSFSFHPSWN